MTPTGTGEQLRTCSCCGLAQVLPDIPPRMKACCSRCGTRLASASVRARSNLRTFALALSALILYPLGVGLPMLRVSELGHHSEASIINGSITLLSRGDLLVGVIVLLCSVVFPLVKLLALLVLSSGSVSGARHRHRALTYHVVEWTGRWGMLDVLLVAVLTAVLKLGDMVEVEPGPAAAAFVACVVLSLLAAASFDPHALFPAGFGRERSQN
jgi:paraquat-inducible protein A